MTNGREFDKPGVYCIRVKGSLDQKWSDWFGGMTLTPQECDETVLTGQVMDQAALHGMLAKIRDLGLPLLYVERIENPSSARPRENGGTETRPYP
jgi:hypothetical protein